MTVLGTSDAAIVGFLRDQWKREEWSIKEEGRSLMREIENYRFHNVKAIANSISAAAVRLALLQSALDGQHAEPGT